MITECLNLAASWKRVRDAETGDQMAAALENAAAMIEDASEWRQRSFKMATLIANDAWERKFPYMLRARKYNYICTFLAGISTGLILAAGIVLVVL